MRFEFASEEYSLLATELKAPLVRMYPEGVVKAFRKLVQLIASAHSEGDFIALRGLRYKRLNPPRNHQWSLRLNDQYRLIIEWEADGDQRWIKIIGIEDYH